ncbi:MAG: lamin tail domain-containing protein [Anaerolineales bacterium]|nr:lamin tail domain-containing protein [Anaerolineales bacterium]
MNKKRGQQWFFWSVILIFLVLSAGQISSAAANQKTSNLVINEFMADNESGLADEDGDYSDWIEIYNPGHTAVNLGAYALTDDPNDLQKWPFPDVTLGSHNYLVVFASGKDRRATGPGAVLHTNFKLSQTGDYLALTNILDDQVMDGIGPSYPEQFGDVAYGRYGAAMANGYLGRPTPGGANDETALWAGVVSPVQFSAGRGFYDAPFTVFLTTATPGATIRYTTDGSEPSETNGSVYDEPVAVNTTTVLRAAAFQPGFLPSKIATQSYFFLADVLAQPATPAGFPASWGAQISTNASGQTGVTPISADYELDPAVVNDSRYQDTLPEGLKALPVMSVVMADQGFFDLHTHPADGEADWEHPVSIELLYPSGDQPGFQVNAGIRLQEEAEQGEFDPKRAFRLLFKHEYGPTKLEYPVFPNSPVDEFDTLLLQPGTMSEPTSYTRDTWLHDTQIAMSGIGSNSTFVHLYLNGLYWGVYRLAERPDTSFLAAYLGGLKEDWFVAGPNGPLKQEKNSRVDRLDYLFTILTFAGQFEAGPESGDDLAQKYAEVASYFDPTEFSDTLILNWYTQLLGWPENSWYAAINRTDSVSRGKLLLWSEVDNSAPSINMPLAAEQASNSQFDLVNSLFQTLRENPDFRMQVADRLYKHLANEGALADAAAETRWLNLSQTLNYAMVAESARWGDAVPGSPLSPDTWRETNKAVFNQMNGQAAKVIAWAREAGYYPPVDPPLFSHEGGLVKSGFNLSMSLPGEPAERGTIYYTTDGSDPRLPVTGAVGPTAQVYQGPVVLSGSAQVKARVLLNQPSTSAEPVWSALHEAGFSVNQEGQPLRITEIMYNPAAGDDYEFIELKNVGSSEVDLSNVSIDEGIYFSFSPNTPPLAAGNTLILVSNPTAFAKLYPGVPIGGVYDGHLSNKGEKILITDAEGETLIELTYDDANGWPVSADGRGDSLVLVDPNGDPNNPQNWRASTHVNGSPGGDEPRPEETALR